MRLLTNKSNNNYWNYVTELRKRRTAAIFEKSLLLIQSNSAKERELGVDILAQFGLPRVHQKQIVSAFVELLRVETNKQVLSATLSGIGHNNDNLTKEQLDLVCSFEAHRSKIVRRSVVAALLTIDTHQAIDTLIELSKDKDTAIRDWATFGLGTQIDADTKKIRTALWNRVTDQDENTKLEAIVGLAQRKDNKIKEVLKIELQNIEECSNLILEAIGKLGDSSFIEPIEALLKKNKTTPAIDKHLLLVTLNELKQQD